METTLPERDATPDEAFELGKVAGYDEAFAQFQERLAAAEAVIEKVKASAVAGLEDCDDDWEMSALWVYETLSEARSSAVLGDAIQEAAAAAWDAGHDSATMRTAQELLALLPQRKNATNPYRSEG